MSEITLALPETITPSGAKSDEQLIGLWLHNRSEHTSRAYQADVGKFLAFVGKPLRAVTLADVQAFENSITSLADTSRSRALSAVKSLLTFAQRLGYLQFNVGAVIKLPKLKNTLSNRILDEREVILMIELEPSSRNKTILEVLYYAGCRVSELSGLRWEDVQPNGEAGQVTIYGKGGKTRVIRLPRRLYDRLLSLRDDHAATDPVFLSRKSHALSVEQVHKIVVAAASRAGLDRKVSAHWLRHAHASHALDNGAPIHLVQATLGHSSLATTSKYVHAKPNDSSGMYLRG